MSVSKQCCLTETQKIHIINYFILWPSVFIKIYLITSKSSKSFFKFFPLNLFFNVFIYYNFSLFAILWSLVALCRTHLRPTLLFVLKRITEMRVKEAGSGWGQDNHVTGDARTTERSKNSCLCWQSDQLHRCDQLHRYEDRWVKVIYVEVVEVGGSYNFSNIWKWRK